MRSPLPLPALRGAGAVVLCALLVIGCAPDDGAGSAEAVTAQVHRPPDVLVYMVDTLRADELGPYGAQVTRTPFLDRFAGTATLFTRASSPAASTRPAVASLMTGVLPGVHGVHDLKNALPPSAASGPARLAVLMRDAGYATGAIVANPNVDPQFGFQPGFDSYTGLYADKDDVSPAYATDLVADARTVGTAVREWWENAPADQPRFLFVLAIDPHAPYSPPREFSRPYDPDALGSEHGSMNAVLEFDRRLRAGEEVSIERLRALYRGEVGYVDDEFGRLVTFLSDRGELDETLVIFTADHGEEFLEHGDRGHGKTVYEEVTRIPLLLRLPAVFASGTERGEEVDLLDVSSTILRTAGIEPPAYWRGRDLSKPVLPARPVASSNLVSRHAARAIRAHGYKLVDDMAAGRRELYSLALDPAEARPLAGEQARARTKELVALLDALDDEARERQGALYGAVGPPVLELVPRKLLEQIRGLGYVD